MGEQEKELNLDKMSEGLLQAADQEIREIQIPDVRRRPPKASGPHRREESANHVQSARHVESARRKKSARRRRRRRIILCTRVCVSLLVLGVAVYLVLPYLKVRAELTIEAGSEPPGVEAFLKWGGGEIVSGLSDDTDLDTVADYPIVIRVYHRQVSAVLHVRDTRAPVVTKQDQTVCAGIAVEPSDFIKKIKDATETSVIFKEEPDWDTEGEQEVVLQVTDEGKNTTEVTAKMEIVVDTEPPVISGVEVLYTEEGGSISYKKGVEVTDNYDENPELTVDNSQVDLNTAGEYPVTYSAVDKAGNEASASTMVCVLPESQQTEIDVAGTIDEKAEEVLASILTDDMSQYEQAEAIYWWCHDKIAYADGASKDDYLQGAYQGLVERRGDCFTYAMTAKYLLTKAGIKNMDIERIPSGNLMHYWNLVDVGEGWYHFDTTRRADKTTFFYKTDEEIKAYSDTHNGTHNYDRSKYPEIN